jgi:hypothetical protein
MRKTTGTRRSRIINPSINVHFGLQLLLQQNNGGKGITVQFAGSFII